MIASPANTAIHVEHSMNGPNGNGRAPSRSTRQHQRHPDEAPRTKAPNPATTRWPQPSQAAYPPTSAGQLHVAEADAAPAGEAPDGAVGEHERNAAERPRDTIGPQPLPGTVSSPSAERDEVGRQHDRVRQPHRVEVDDRQDHGHAPPRTGTPEAASPRRTGSVAAANRAAVAASTRG